MRWSGATFVERQGAPSVPLQSDAGRPDKGSSQGLLWGPIYTPPAFCYLESHTQSTLTLSLNPRHCAAGEMELEQDNKGPAYDIFALNPENFDPKPQAVCS